MHKISTENLKIGGHNCVGRVAVSRQMRARHGCISSAVIRTDEVGIKAVESIGKGRTRKKVNEESQ